MPLLWGQRTLLLLLTITAKFFPCTSLLHKLAVKHLWKKRPDRSFLTSLIFLMNVIQMKVVEIVYCTWFNLLYLEALAIHFSSKWNGYLVTMGFTPIDELKLVEISHGKWCPLSKVFKLLKDWQIDAFTISGLHTFTQSFPNNF